MRVTLPPLLAFVSCVLLWATGLATADAAERQAPNILFLFADDQRADTIAALGNPVISTPNLDRLVRRGLSFNRAYMAGSNNAATCIPSRAMLLSGQSLKRIDQTLMRDKTWPEAFRGAGYTTFVSGKWHNGGASVSKCFEFARAIFTGGMGDPLHTPLRNLEDGVLRKPFTPDKHACEVFADEAVDFLSKHKGAPFLCYIPFDAPHDPHIVPKSFPVQYNPAAIPLPPNFTGVHPFDNGEMTVRDELLLASPRSEEAVRQMLADYYRYVSYLDAQVGRILDALEASPFADNTIVVFSADSGVARGSHGLIGKQNLYEHSVRVPLLVSGPGIPKGARTDAMCYLYDVFPTLGAACRVQAPEESEGRDFSAVLREPSLPGRELLQFSYKDVQLSVRDNRWKLIYYPKVDVTQLYDLEADPQEAKDMSAEPEAFEPLFRLAALVRGAR
jgi:arylsulfatase A-like enzyme